MPMPRSSVRHGGSPVPPGRFRRVARLAATAAASGALLLGGVASPGPASAAGSTKADAYNDIGSTDRSKWMKGVAGDTWLASLSLPGTHDTLSLHGGVYVKTQQDFGDSANTLTRQLERGIRAIDIRVRVTENKYFTVHHAAYYQKANFDDVLTKARDFLRKNSSETVVMRLKAECPRGDRDIQDCANDPKTVTSGRIEEIFKEYLSRYPDLFYGPSVSGASKAWVPRLSDVRGKIVLGAFDSIDRSGSYGISSFDDPDTNEDSWSLGDSERRWDAARANLDQAMGDGTGRMFVTYTSGSDAPWASPAAFAGGYVRTYGDTTITYPSINFELMKYLNNGDVNRRVGIVMMDFPGWALIENVIARNNPHFAQSGHQSIWTVNADKTYVDTRFNRCMVRGPEFNSAKTDGLVTQRACQSTAPVSHQWQAERPSAYDGKGYHWIRSSNGKCLTVPYNGGTPPPSGTQLYWWGCETRWYSGSQLWNVIPTQIEVGGVRKKAYKFINEWTGKCLTVDPGAASTSGGKVTHDTCPS
ncbi:phosphatidylinositol-specific phospholipase C domain-containing protein [Streptomyces sp. JNUCC 64]